MLINENIDPIKFNHDHGLGILEVENFFTKNDCDKYIEFFESCRDEGNLFERDENKKNFVTDLSFNFPEQRLDLENKNSFTMEYGTRIYNYINERFWNSVWPEYIKKYSILDKHVFNFSFKKIQRTDPSQGFHAWHSEKMDMKSSTRVLFYILYLNDDFEAGETEFLYQQKRFKPKTGSMILAPSDWLFTHRGNPPIGGTKYIVTSWAHYG